MKIPSPTPANSASRFLRSLAPLAFAAAMATTWIANKAEAIMLVPTPTTYDINGTINLTGDFQVNQDDMYVAAYYYYGAEQTEVTVAHATLTPQSTSEIAFTATVSIPVSQNDMYGYSLIGNYSSEASGGVCVSFRYTEGIVGQPWDDIFNYEEGEIYVAVQTGDTGTLHDFALDNEDIHTPFNQESYLIGFSDGQEIARVNDVTANPVPEPAAIPLLAGCLLLPTLLLRRRIRK